MKTTHVIVKGLVQGVWFRDCTRQQANAHNITGWVRNLPDRSVEVMLSGAETDVTAMLQWLRQGSPHSRVDDLLISDISSTEQYHTFEIRYD